MSIPYIHPFCTDLTSIPFLPELEILQCRDCPLISIPYLPELIILGCHDCPYLISIPSMSRLEVLDYSKCPWLYVKPERIDKLIVIQRRIRQLIKYFRFVRFIKSKEFNEWFYAPDGIGGKNHKIKMEQFMLSINQ